MWPQVKQASDSYTNGPGLLLFSIMFGANDSVVATPAQHGSNLTSVVNALLANYPDSCIVIRHPLWHSKMPHPWDSIGQKPFIGLSRVL